ncbi:hypothetical protein [Wolbachia endosymbiont of Aedes albopictus]|uniref:hypothetical protein n=1 Tax=Wolbachia endosymbiont of Aedes albopictus TaxID=167957 RepID=UPI00216876DA|nr:hypothetical protein [Wolbachia endosymbiont of Aedes albopictus]UVW84138.1 hypothetical protein NHG98_01300 [Wolbachia endosymbiont of Aedes albopictus]
MWVKVRVSSQCLFLCHPSSLTTWIQEKEWCHASSLLLLSSQYAPSVSFQCSFLVIRVAPFLSSQCPDTGIQVF